MATDTAKIRNITRWLALACLVVPMFGSYFFDDMFSSLSQLFRSPELLELGWDSADYGFYAGGYSFLCVWGGLIVCGMLLDKWGVRITGSIFVGTHGSRCRHRDFCDNVRDGAVIFIAHSLCRMHDIRSRQRNRRSGSDSVHRQMVQGQEYGSRNGTATGHRQTRYSTGT